MGYGLNWDLSGRFFPYMGLFLPPKMEGKQWANDRQGTQAKLANISDASIAAYYTRTQARGFGSLSYWNVFEFGLDVTYDAHPPAVPAPPPRDGDWHNASAYLAARLRSSLVTDCCDEALQPSTEALYTWQRGVVVDPSPGTPYEAHLLEQLDFKFDRLNGTFQGLVVDRSDWAAVYNHDRDDGVSLACGRPGYSFKRAFASATSKVRAGMAARRAKAGPKVMLANTLGYAMLSLMGPFDGSFSEGSAVNAVGLLGLRSPAILWTYGESAWKVGGFDAFAQRHLYMGVYPMVSITCLHCARHLASCICIVTLHLHWLAAAFSRCL